jgi:hypothetical protein
MSAYLYAYIAIAVLVECVFAYSVQPGERVNETVEGVLAAVGWPIYLAWYVATIAFEFWTKER